MVAPAVVITFLQCLLETKGEEAELKARHTIHRKWKMNGLLGLPIWTLGAGAGSEHWTLAVFRRTNSEVQARYYDSATELNAYNRSAFELLCAHWGPRERYRAPRLRGYCDLRCCQAS